MTRENGIISIICITTILLFSMSGFFEENGSGYDTPKGAMVFLGHYLDYYTIRIIELNPTCPYYFISWYILDQDRNVVGELYENLE